MSYKLVGVRYPNSVDVSNRRSIEPVVVETEDSSKLSDMIANMLFDQYEGMNYVLTRWGGSLYICEPVDYKNKRYDKAKITSHPYQHLT
jgi:hypothetical protein